MEAFETVSVAIGSTMGLFNTVISYLSEYWVVLLAFVIFALAARFLLLPLAKHGYSAGKSDTVRKSNNHNEED